MFSWRKPTRLRDFDYAAPNSIFFSTARARRGLFPFVDAGMNEEIIDLFVRERSRIGHAIYVYCLMPNDYHLLCSPLESGKPITALMGGINSQIIRLLWAQGYKGKCMQRSFYDHVVRREEDLREIARYILDNPVRRGLVERAEDYP